MTPGIHSIPFAEYTALDAVSNTALGKINSCPAAYRYWREHPDEKATPAMKLGRIAHRAILEPREFAREFVTTYAVKPEGMSFATKDGKAFKATAEENGLEVITKAEADFLKGAAQSIAAHPTAAAMLHSGAPEQSVIADYNGIPIKARVDFLTNGDSLIDLKTTASAEPRWFERDILNLSYFRQGAFYLDCCKAAGLPVKHFCLLAVEKTPPYLVACYQLSRDYIELGRQEYVRLIGLLAECQKSGRWPSYSDSLIKVDPPAWKLRELPVQDPPWMTEAAA